MLCASWRVEEPAKGGWASLGVFSGIVWFLFLLVAFASFFAGKGQEFISALSAVDEALANLRPGVVVLDLGVLLGGGGVVGSCLLGLAVTRTPWHDPPTLGFMSWLRLVLLAGGGLLAVSGWTLRANDKRRPNR